MSDTATPTPVPCNGCTLCCYNEQIIIHPDMGDDLSFYETIDATHPLTGNPVKMLPHKENGACFYLGEKGCEIYENRPVICREYDCRKQFLTLTSAIREKIVKKFPGAETRFEAGKQRQHTLTGEERLKCIAIRKKR